VRAATIWAGTGGRRPEARYGALAEGEQHASRHVAVGGQVAAGGEHAGSLLAGAAGQCRVVRPEQAIEVGRSDIVGVGGAGRAGVGGGAAADDGRG
jgi:hypothetical protein